MKRTPFNPSKIGTLAFLLVAFSGTLVGGCGDGGGTSTSGGNKPACGDGKIDTGEECDDGTNNADTGACTTMCKTAICGDGFIQPETEECDDGTNNSDTGSCTAWCKVATCGDSFVHAGVEECDKGVDNADTAECTTSCKNATCGDAFVQTGTEECDDGAKNADTAACTSACKAATCGDGFIQANVEQCDEGPNNADTSACTSTCKIAICGDSLVQAGVEGCDLGAQNSDMGMCTSMCKSASCGDGLVETSVEQCDLGANNANTGACTIACKTATCGDGLLQAGVEQCDLGASNANTGACTLACKNAACGDGFLQAGEVCDDGNAVNGDGCNNNCVVSGTPIFTQSYNSGATAGDSFYSVKLDASGNIIIGGSVAVAGQGLNTFVAKYDALGALLWSRTYNNAFNGDDEAASVAVDPQGNIIAVGYESLSATNVNIWIRKYDTNGNTIWTQSYSGQAGTGIDVGYGVATNAMGDIFMSAAVSTVASGRDIIVAKIAGLNGSYTWSEQVNGTGNSDDEALSIAVDAAGKVYVSGYSIGATGNPDTWVRKYQDNGVTYTALWTRTANGSGNGNDYGFGVAFDAAGDLIVTGTETVAGPNYNIWTRKYDANGNVLWTQSHNGTANVNDLGSAVSVDAAGNIIVIGHEGQTNATFDIWVNKYDANGVTRWTQRYNGNADQNDYGGGVTTDANGFIFAVGTETTLAQGPNGWLRKYNP